MTRIVAPVDFGGPEQLALSEVPTPEPGPGEVRVAVRAIGVNPIDWKQYSGRMGRDPAALGRLGYELAGVVDAVGEGVADWQTGDEVIATDVPGNGYTDQAVVPADGLIAKPERLSWEQASGIAVAGGTAAHAVEAAQLSDGDVVLMHGAAGGVGGLVVQLAKRRGARVIATASERNHDYLRSLGAEPVTYGDGLVDRGAGDRAGRGGRGHRRSRLGRGGRRVAGAGRRPAPDRQPGRLRARADGISLIGTGGPGVDPGTEVRKAAQPEVARLVAGQLSFPVQQTYPLEETAQAHRDGLTGHTRGKLVVVP